MESIRLRIINIARDDEQIYSFPIDIDLKKIKKKVSMHCKYVYKGPTYVYNSMYQGPRFQWGVWAGGRSWKRIRRRRCPRQRPHQGHLR